MSFLGMLNEITETYEINTDNAVKQMELFMKQAFPRKVDFLQWSLVQRVSGKSASLSTELKEAADTVATKPVPRNSHP